MRFYNHDATATTTYKATFLAWKGDVSIVAAYLPTTILFPYMTVGVNLPTKLLLPYMQIRRAQFWLEHGHLFIRVASDEKITVWNRPWIIPSHSIESPGTLDPQWNIWYWGSKWNVHTVCRDAVGCGWATTSVYFRITYVCFIPSRLPVFAVEPRYRLQYFLFLCKESFEGHTQHLQKNNVSPKFECVCVANIDCEVVNVFHLRFSLVACVMAYWELLMQTCWWPLSDHWSVQVNSPQLSGFLWYGGLKASWSYLRYAFCRIMHYQHHFVFMAH